MADEKTAAPAEGVGEEEGKKGGKPMLVIGIIAGVIILQTAIVYLIVPKPEAEAAKAAKLAEDSLRLAAEAATRMGAVTSDAPIEAVVNIAGTDGDRFLKFTILLEYDEKNVQLGNELRQRIPRYKDLCSDHMSTLTFPELTEPGARDKIRKDLTRMINANLPAKIGEVQNVLFTTFIIQ